MRSIVAGAALILAVVAGPARAAGPAPVAGADILEAGPRGGFYCLDDREVAATIRGDHRSSPSGLGPSCSRIEPGAKVVTLATRETVPAIVGVARIKGVGEVGFALYRASR